MFYLFQKRHFFQILLWSFSCHPQSGLHSCNVSSFTLQVTKTTHFSLDVNANSGKSFVAVSSIVSLYYIKVIQSCQLLRLWCSSYTTFRPYLRLSQVFASTLAQTTFYFINCTKGWEFFAEFQKLCHGRIDLVNCPDPLSYYYLFTPN